MLLNKSSPKSRNLNVAHPGKRKKSLENVNYYMMLPVVNTLSQLEEIFASSTRLREPSHTHMKVNKRNTSSKKPMNLKLPMKTIKVLLHGKLYQKSVARNVPTNPNSEQTVNKKGSIYGKIISQTFLEKTLSSRMLRYKTLSMKISLSSVETSQ